ncbi:Wzz/FepE/Etk N-terminal domain-containing protein [Pontibacter sp. G13]|uniref:GumC family protein n=1 Tax=Pontibacter sp. G13 TaxID=3074898 RepID=UPI00288B2203|nr:Wzz/FepE/Etk N-terminal domain-containing protein [Pontibacter sp. G13]WNJ20918.1 Wzz/FepE/Etk N-terminal domain-containing protein [Pontibacter sp. G13]
MDLINLLRVLLRRKWLILAIVSVAMVTTFLIANKVPPSYEVTAQLSTGLVEGSGVSFSESAPEYQVEARFQTMVSVIQSPQVLDLVSYQLILHDLEKTQPFRSLEELKTRYQDEELRVAAAHYQVKLDSLKPMERNGDLDLKHSEILGLMAYDHDAILENLEVMRLPGTDLIEVRFRSEDPYLSAFVANNLCQEFIRYYTFARSEQARNSIAFYNNMVTQNRRDLDDKIQMWERNRDGSQTTVVSSVVQGVLDKIDRLERERNRVYEDLYRSERELIEIRNNLPGSERASYLSPNGTRDYNMILLLQQSLNRMVGQYVRADFSRGMSDSLKQVRGDLTAEVYQEVIKGMGRLNGQRESLIRDKIDREIDVLVSTQMVRALDQELGRIAGSAGSLASASSKSPFVQDVELARDAYLQAMDQLNEAKLNAYNVADHHLSQVAFVQAPEHPTPPKTFMLTILAGLISFSMCLVVFVFLEYLDTSIRYPSRFTDMTGLSMIGPLNRLNTTNLDLVALFSETHKNPSLENYKQLLRKIRFEVISEGAKTIMITSTKSGSGKTSLLVSLAYSLSLSGKRVLIIDTNFKNNSLTQITAASPSLERFLSKELPRKALISSSVFEGVDVIGCEGGNYSPSEIFASDMFNELLEQLKREYDIILLEGSHLNEYADSRELERYIEKIIPVFAANKGVNSADRRSILYLESLGDKVQGAILNKVEIRNLTL